jgi:hypothetical protein
MIRNMTKFQDWPPAGFDGQFHWEFTKGAFGPVIMPMDLDGIVERNGRFFVFETKHSEDVSIPWGQQRTLKALVRTGFFSVMVLYGKSADEITSYIIWHENTERLVKPANAELVYAACAQWYEWVNSLPAPEYPDQLQALNVDLRRENSQLRKSLIKANDRAQVLTDYINRIEKSFRLESPKQKPVPKKSLSLTLGLHP